MNQPAKKGDYDMITCLWLTGWHYNNMHSPVCPLYMDIEGCQHHQVQSGPMPYLMLRKFPVIIQFHPIRKAHLTKTSLII